MVAVVSAYPIWTTKYLPSVVISPLIAMGYKAHLTSKVTVMDFNSLLSSQWDEPETITTGADFISPSFSDTGWHPEPPTVAMNGMTHALASLETFFTTHASTSSSITPSVPGAFPLSAPPPSTFFAPPQIPPPDQIAPSQLMDEEAFDFFQRECISKLQFSVCTTLFLTHNNR